MDETQKIQALGRTLAEAVGSKQATGLVRGLYTVATVNDDGTIDVQRGADDYIESLTGIPYTTGCVGIAAGSRAIVDTYNHKSIAVGVLS